MYINPEYCALSVQRLNTPVKPAKKRKPRQDATPPAQQVDPQLPLFESAA